MLDQPHEFVGGAGGDRGRPRIHGRERVLVWHRRGFDPPFDRRASRAGVFGGNDLGARGGH